MLLYLPDICIVVKLLDNDIIVFDLFLFQRQNLIILIPVSNIIIKKIIFSFSSFMQLVCCDSELHSLLKVWIVS